jgi:N-acetylneuraminic acid mutarotase
MVGTGGLHEFDPLTSTWRVLNVNKPFKGTSGAFAIVTNDGVVIGSGYSQYSGYELWKYRP